MLNLNDDDETEKLTDSFAIRYPFYIKIGFGLVVLFACIGSFMGKSEQSLSIFIITALLWTNARIANEAIASYTVLWELNKIKKDDADDSK